MGRAGAVRPRPCRLPNQDGREIQTSVGSSHDRRPIRGPLPRIASGRVPHGALPKKRPTLLGELGEVLRRPRYPIGAPPEILHELGRHKRARKNRITALKSFTAYLREQEATLTNREDPTSDLKVPPARPQKAIREKGYPIEDVEKLYPAIDGWQSNKYGWKGTGRTVDVQSVRDVLVLHAKCGMHATEIDRLASGLGGANRSSASPPCTRPAPRFLAQAAPVHLRSRRP